MDLFGTIRRVGFYSTFTAMSELSTDGIARDDSDDSVHAIRGPHFAGVQFHPESVLSRDGMAVLAELLVPIMTNTVSPAVSG